MKPLRPTENPLFAQGGGEVKLETLPGKLVHRRKLQTEKRQLRDLRNKQTAREAIAGLDHATEIFGFTKGQFSLLDLIGAALELTGPVHLSVSTWTAAPHEIQALGDILRRGDVTGTRWLIDFSMARRDPAATSQLRDTFGRDAVRVAQNHAKFAVLQNAQWKMVLRSSMNLNMNPRFEDFQIAHDPELAAFLNGILDQIWAKQSKQMIDAKPYDICKFFQEEM
jgi:hypothetical protein